MPHSHTSQFARILAAVAASPSASSASAVTRADRNAIPFSAVIAEEIKHSIGRQAAITSPATRDERRNRIVF